jgi:hypothetical protein
MLTYEIWAKQELVVLRSYGETTVDEFVLSVKRMRRDPGYSAKYNVLTDLTEHAVHYTPAEVKQLVTRLAPRKPIQNAIIAPQNVAFGLSRMYEMLVEPAGQTRVAVFRVWEEALAWLRLDQSLLPRLQSPGAGGAGSPASCLTHASTSPSPDALPGDLDGLVGSLQKPLPLHPATPRR